MFEPVDDFLKEGGVEFECEIHLMRWNLYWKHEIVVLTWWRRDEDKMITWTNYMFWNELFLTSVIWVSS